MKVRALIEALLTVPSDCDVKMVWDGAAMSDVELVAETHGGFVALYDRNEPVYGTDDRPISAPTKLQEQHWYTEQ